MGQLVGPLISVLHVLAFPLYFDGLPYLPCYPMRFPADDCRLIPVDDVTFSVVLTWSVVADLFWCISLLCEVEVEVVRHLKIYVYRHSVRLWAQLL